MVVLHRLLWIYSTIRLVGLWALSNLRNGSILMQDLSQSEVRCHLCYRVSEWCRFSAQVCRTPSVATSEGPAVDDLTAEEVNRLLERRISLVPLATEKGCGWLQHVIEKDEPLDLFEAQAAVRNFLIKAPCRQFWSGKTSFDRILSGPRWDVVDSYPQIPYTFDTFDMRVFVWNWWQGWRTKISYWHVWLVLSRCVFDLIYRGSQQYPPLKDTSRWWMPWSSPGEPLNREEPRNRSSVSCASSPSLTGGCKRLSIQVEELDLRISPEKSTRIGCFCFWCVETMGFNLGPMYIIWVDIQHTDTPMWGILTPLE